MKTLILYNSKNGATEKCVKYVAQKLNGVNLFKVTEFKGEIKDYDQIILGTPVYIGSYDKKIKQFMIDHLDYLLSIEFSLLVCSMNKSESDEVVKNNLPSELIEHAKIYHVGGAYYFDKMNWLQRFVVKKMAKIKETLEDFDYNMLDQLCEKTK